MTAILPPEEASTGAGQALRMVAIQANLLPTEVTDARRDRRVRRATVLGIAIVLVLLTAWYGQASYDTSTQQNRLTTAQDNVQNLTNQQKKYSDLLGTQEKIQTISNQLSTVLADDLQWSKLLVGLAGVAPGGITLSAVSGELNSVSFETGTGTTVNRLPNGTSYKTIGTLTLAGIATTKPILASYADQLTTVTGLAAPLIVSTLLADGKHSFTLKLEITAAALGGRFSTSPSASAGTGS
jgi:Tfp pilus assembly protein PilN